ncbi:alpha-glucosidase [Halobacteria archaeon HArc-curdl5-1]|uniref:Alpha-glucosidase n=1 Tax=Halapricum hydrolyticum TaxID=2979991 RepID=A0AAE3LDR8_9EURY|nr:alpha-glucosidase [Halapricum hydrolyticum]MCU4725417.1 alpha-glucosidase [Halapricum hydrolyticum]
MERAWWKEAVVYQIYPRSFNDSDGDGVGDIPGIIEKVDYLDELGIDVVWLCPVYDSPNADNGYDIRDYRSIMDEMGAMADWERLLEALHARDIKLVMDLVVNHTSDEHEWFQKSRREEDGYADYYHWVEGDPDKPPNNWESYFGGPAWSYDETREAWYLHLFDEKQPDLNWRNPDVREAIYDVVNWWLERGIDGFRMDVINLLSKPEGYPDGEVAGYPTGHEHFVDGPRIHEYLRGLYEETFAHYDVMTVGEMVDLDVETANAYLGADGDGLNMVFHFDHTFIDFGPEGRWDVGEWSVSDFEEIFTEWQTGLDETSWDGLYWENHDQPRVVSRFGDDEQYRYESATMLGTLLFGLRGTPYVYQGQEIGMTNADFESLEETRDVDTRRPVEIMLEEGEIDSYEEIRDVVNYRSRDNARTPMQWSGEDNAGFTDGDPWIKVNNNYTEINVEASRSADRSVWQYYRELVDLRHDEQTLVYGEYDLVETPDPLYAFTRTLEDDQLLVVLNWSDGERSPPSLSIENPTLLIGNYEDAEARLDSALRPYEARIYRL